MAALNIEIHLLRLTVTAAEGGANMSRIHLHLPAQPLATLSKLVDEVRTDHLQQFVLVLLIYSTKHCAVLKNIEDIF